MSLRAFPPGARKGNRFWLLRGTVDGGEPGKRYEVPTRLFADSPARQLSLAVQEAERDIRERTAHRRIPRPGEAVSFSAALRLYVAWRDPSLADLGRLANENPPKLRTVDAKGNRIDFVEFHPAYHAMMASFGDFIGRLDKYGNGAKAYSAIGHRIIDDLVTGSFLGMAGDWARLVMNETFHRAEMQHVWNPFDPSIGLSPSQGLVGQMFNVVKKLVQQGFLSPEDMNRAAAQMVSSFREAKNIGYATPGLGPNLWGYSEAKGYQDRNFARSKIDEFFSANPGLDHRDLSGHSEARNSRMGGFEKPIWDALVAGDGARAKSLFNNLVQGTGLKRAEALKDLRASMRFQAPIPLNQTDLKLFGGKWGQANLSDGEMQRMHDSQTKFINTAHSAGLLKPGETKKMQLGYSAKGKKFAPPIILQDLP